MLGVSNLLLITRPFVSHEPLQEEKAWIPVGTVPGISPRSRTDKQLKRWQLQTPKDSSSGSDKIQIALTFDQRAGPQTREGSWCLSPQVSLSLTCLFCCPPPRPVESRSLFKTLAQGRQDPNPTPLLLSTAGQGERLKNTMKKKQELKGNGGHSGHRSRLLPEAGSSHSLSIAP